MSSTPETPRTRDPQAKIAAIRTAAADLIIESGPECLTHRAVASRANVAVGTTTKYFATLDELKTSALELLVEEITTDLDNIKKLLADAPDESARIDALASTFMSWLEDERNLFRECALVCNGVFREEFRDISLRWYEGFADVLQPYYSAGQAEVLGQFLDGAMLHTALTRRSPTKERARAVIASITTSNLH